MTQSIEPVRERAVRSSLYVQVQVHSQPVLDHCWSVNVSTSGIGLISSKLANAPGPRVGDEIDLEFPLPGTGSTVRAQGMLVWRNDGVSVVEGRVAISLGFRFEPLAPAGLIKLSRYLADNRIHVAAAFASTLERRLIQKVLGSSAQLHFAQTAGELETLISRGDIAVLVVCGREDQGLDAIDELASRVAQSAMPGGLQPRDLAARIIFCAKAGSHRLVELFNSGKIFRALPIPLQAEALEGSVLAAGREHGLRVGQQRIAYELELSRERETSRSAARPEPALDGLVELSSPKMQAVMELVRIGAPPKIAILLQGETGTGKEVLASAVHALSDRARGPFIIQDCGVLTETLLESELFGHVRGAFTGAVSDHPGLFVFADGGTVFLDEIENTTPNLQAKLLRVLETGEVRPVGGTQVRVVDVRVIVATNRKLAQEVKAGILPLALHFLARFNSTHARTVSGLTTEAEQALLAADWPGNVRELKNVIERAVLLGSAHQPIALKHLPEALAPRAALGVVQTDGLSLKMRVDRMEEGLIRAALERSKGVLRQAARELRTDPATLLRKVKRHRIGSAKSLSSE